MDIIDVRDRMILGLEDFDFTQMLGNYLILPKFANILTQSVQVLPKKIKICQGMRSLPHLLRHWFCFLLLSRFCAYFSLQSLLFMLVEAQNWFLLATTLLYCVVQKQYRFSLFTLITIYFAKYCTGTAVLFEKVPKCFLEPVPISWYFYFVPYPSLLKNEKVILLSPGHWSITLTNRWASTKSGRKSTWEFKFRLSIFLRMCKL